jgi:hypothetical protein
MNKLLLCTIFLVLNSFAWSQNAAVSSKRFKINELDRRTFSPLVVNTKEGKTVMIFIRPKALIGKNTTIFLAVFDEKWTKIAHKEYITQPDIIKIMGQSRNKLENFSTDLFNVIEAEDAINLYYERTEVVAHLKISKKDWSIKQMPDIAFDESKMQVTIFEKDRTIIKTGVYNNHLYVLVPHKEDNQLWLYNVDKNAKVEKKLVKMPVIKHTKDNGKVKEIAFNKFTDIHLQDSLALFLFESQDNDDKIFQTIALNLENQKARTVKYAYPKEGFFKEKDKTQTMTYLFEDKVFMSVINDKKYTLSIRNNSTGEELKNISFDIRKDIAISNSKPLKRSVSYRGGLPNPFDYKEKELTMDKYWDSFIGKGGFFGSRPTIFGVFEVTKIDSCLRLSFGAEYISSVTRQSSSTNYGTGAVSTKTSYSQLRYDCDIEHTYINSYLGSRGLNPVSAKKVSNLELEYEKIGQLESKMCCLTRFQKNGIDYFSYFDKKSEELVIVSSK